uniref:Uncharacterized protein n=1 Tax=uncultured prokaryote TaxID=198431 RepID=A0A0H5Q4T5_9ZZZZ|nr:hypothetical protein [uncultured prokaryote]
MTSRTGMPAITKVAREMCRLIVKFTPIIRVVTDNSSPVLLALEAANAACAALDEALQDYIEEGV